MNNTKPFIKLFKTPLGFYCYDVNTFSLLKITKGMYEYLNGNIQKEDIDTQKRIDNLSEKGYLSSHRANEMKHPYTDIIKDYLTHNIRKITLQITQNCNLACKYCAYANQTNGLQRQHSNKSMSLEIAKKGIDFLFTHSDSEDEINIGFYGGEPLLEFTKIKELIRYAEEQEESFKRSVCFSMTTNATLLNDEKIRYFLKHNIRILISFDGPKDIHNKNRVYRRTGAGCFDDVMEKLLRIRNKYPKFMKQVSINAVLDPENQFSCYDEFFTSYDIINEFKIITNVVNSSLL